VKRTPATPGFFHPKASKNKQKLNRQRLEWEFGCEGGGFRVVWGAGMGKGWIIGICWLGVVVLGAWLRFEHLAARPFHADGATGAKITALRLESGDYRFDPTHYHGPLLSALAGPVCRMRGEDGWREMTKESLRLPIAVVGWLLVLVPLLGRRRWGDGPMLLAAALLATSPLLVYYSRMFIHESLLATFGMAAVVSMWVVPRYAVPGVLVGLMYATKETFVISLAAWAAAGVMVGLETGKLLDRAWLVETWRKWWKTVAVSAVAAVLVAAFFYTDAFRHPSGAWDAVRTYFVYKIGEHQKPFWYYMHLLVVPKHEGGLWWFETPVAVLALAGWAWGYTRKARQSSAGLFARFLGYASAAHLLVYSFISYKTPWLMCLPWAHVCLLAGFSAGWFAKGGLRWLGVLVAAGVVVSQTWQSRQTTGPFASDGRNPYAYVPTSPDIESLPKWLHELAAASPETGVEPMGVIGTEYWPLPWYLRSFKLVGYWPEAPANIGRLPVVLATGAEIAPMMERLADTHVPVPRGLRDEAPVMVFVRNDLWNP